MSREIDASDFRRPEFRHARIEDYELRSDGAVVRKDRWESGVRSIASLLDMPGGDWEITDVVERARQLVLQAQAPISIGQILAADQIWEGLKS